MEPRTGRCYSLDTEIGCRAWLAPLLPPVSVGH